LNKKSEEIKFVEDLILLCSEVVTETDAQRGIRTLCRAFGGTLVYVPSKKETGKSAERIRGALADAVNDRAANSILEKIMIVYGGMQIYIPIERSAFKKIMGLEIYERYENGISINDLAKDYNISFTHAYRLYHQGKREKYKRSLPYLPFLEFLQ
jgi:hypothetical protein